MSQSITVRLCGLFVGRLNLPGIGMLALGFAAGIVPEAVATADSCDHPVFATRKSFTSSINQNSRYLRFGDLDGDGDLDAVTGQQGVFDFFCNCYPGEISVLFNDGNGLYSQAVAYEETDFLNGVELGDLDDDGDLDVVVGNTRDHQLWIYFNDGKGTLSLLGIYPLSRPSGIGIGDFDHDDDVDLLIRYSPEVPGSRPRFRVYLNNGPGDFVPGADFENPLGGLAALGDLNGNGTLDAVVTSAGSGEVGVFLGQGNGTFVSGLTFPVDLYPKDAALGDFDGDDDLDLVTANFESSTVSILRSNGDGTFEPRITHAVGDLPLSVAVGDVDGDADLDIVTGDSAGGLPGFRPSLSVLINDGDGNFAPAVQHDSGAQPGSLQLADIDGDLDLDVGTVFREGFGALNLVPGNGDGTFGPKGPVLAGVGTTEVLAGDLDGDRFPEFVVLNGSDGDASVFRNSGQGDPINRVDFPIGVGAGPRRGELVDLDGDLALDLVVADFLQGAVAFLAGGGDATFSSSRSFAAGLGPVGLAVADFDGDALLDVATANRDSDDVTVLRNLGGGVFAAPVAWPVGTRPEEIVAGDLDGDKSPDLIAANVDFGFGDTISVLRNTGDGNFETQTVIQVGEAPRGLALGDPNGDGAADLAVANSGSDSVSLLLNRGDGTFAPPVSYAGLFDAVAVVWSDVNGDGAQDLLLGAAEDQFASRRLAVLFGRGDGTLEIPFFYRSDWEPHRLQVIDADLDGALDVTVLETLDSLSVVMGQCSVDLIFADGFESGDASGWSAQSP